MRKRLYEAFDSMTMPDDCARRIEQQLKSHSEGQKREKYTMAVSPASRRNWWTVAASAVCLVLVVAVGGTALFLGVHNNTDDDTPVFTQPSAPATEATAETVPYQETVVREDQSAAMVEFIKILGESGQFYAVDYDEKMSIQEYCDVYAATAEITLDIPKFTVVDMDGDGGNEVVLWLRVNGTSDYGTLVLRYQDGIVRGYPFAYRQLSELKADGTFQWSGGSSHNGTGLLHFTGTECTVEQTLYQEADGNHVIHYYQDGTEIELEEYYLLDIQQMAKKDAQWHGYPCEQIHGLLESYEYADLSKESAAVSTYYYYVFFQSLAGGHIGREASSWGALRSYLTEEGHVWSTGEEGCLTVYFPDIPGSWFYAWPDGINDIGEIGYYICTEDGEYEVKALDLNTDSPRFFVDVDRMGEGTQAATSGEVDDYIAAITGISRELELEQLAVTTCLEQFSGAYFTGSTWRMRELLADDFSGAVEAYGGSQDYVVNRNIGWPEEVLQVGDKFTVAVEFKESPEADSYSYLTMELIKQEDGWKVLSYGLEK